MNRKNRLNVTAGKLENSALRSCSILEVFFKFFFLFEKLPSLEFHKTSDFFQQDELYKI